MQIAVVGAGIAGLAAAAAFSRSGHDVAVYEQADSLRASGLAINLWSNATSLLPALGVPADRIPGQPFSRMVLRSTGREVRTVALPPRGLPHVTVERADLLTALADTLPPGVIRYGSRCSDAPELAARHDLVVAADGTHSALRNAVSGPPRGRRTWTVWQATVSAEIPQLPTDACVSVVRPGFFSGIFPLPDGRITWFAEQPGRPAGTGHELLRNLAADPDPVLRAAAGATAAGQWTEWSVADLWPAGRMHRGNVVLIGDAAHAVLPTVGQGACQSVADGPALAAAVTAEPDLDQALRRYARERIRRLRLITSMSRVTAVARRTGAARHVLPEAAIAHFMAAAGGPVLRYLTRPESPGEPGTE
jgi:FAD-dependent urate hydroxylase